jgi:2-polyprenyl-3-methyl-5-hydroxy-6-metoxy-1,4-benzoquinol methylase
VSGAAATRRKSVDPPARIVDVGGATGVYARPLAEAGYQVNAVDPVPGWTSCSPISA